MLMVSSQRVTVAPNLLATFLLLAVVYLLLIAVALLKESIALKLIAVLTRFGRFPATFICGEDVLESLTGKATKATIQKV
jgi:hypothetical protein